MALEDVEHLREIFSGFGPVSVRRMFGGAGIYAEGTMFALVFDGEIYLKADEETIPAFRAEGAGPFVYSARGRRIVMSYWRLPDRLIDEPEELANWARTALAAARRATAMKPQRKRKTISKQKRRRRR